MSDTPAPRRILVVEDDDSIATALEYVVRKEGLTCDRVATGSEAIGRIRSFHPDLLLLDIMLPEISGYDICDTVRRDPALGDLKILMMTARGSANEARRALEHGADGFITKPFDLTTLRGEISRLLGAAA
jgi:DNA-binding response OmpR family regulator